MSIASRFNPILAAFAAAALLCGCLVKDKPDKPLVSGGLAPPWDPAKFTPKRLEGYVYAGTESTFTLFGDISRLDSLAGDPKEWKPEPGAMDTLRILQVFDTTFVFPQNPEAIMPYGYDDSFRDDTLYRKAFGNGLFSQDHPCAETYVLSGRFPHPAKWLRTGLKPAEIINALGTPMYRQAGVLRYLSRHLSPAPAFLEGNAAREVGLAAGAADSHSLGLEPDSSALRSASDASASASAATSADHSAYDVYEGMNFYFQADSLFAAVLQKSQPCH